MILTRTGDQLYGDFMGGDDGPPWDKLSLEMQNIWHAMAWLDHRLQETRERFLADGDGFMAQALERAAAKLRVLGRKGE